MVLRIALLFGAIAGAAGLLGRVSQHRNTAPVPNPDFQEFSKKYGRTHELGTMEYAMRQDIFERIAVEVERLNAKPGRSWTAAVNELSDRTEDELASIRGWVRSSTSVSQGRSNQDSQQSWHLMSTDSGLPPCVSWKHLHSMQDLSTHDQGPCGSCWAFSTAKVMQAHTELYSTERTFSQEQIMSCVENKEHCGGTGGCAGATVGLAMDYLLGTTCETIEKIPYQGTEARCVTEKYHHQPVSENITHAATGDTIHLLSLQTSASSLPGPQFGFVGWQMLAQTELALMSAIFEKGPVAISVSATDSWNQYGSGIMSREACPVDAVVNHAVTAIGYGEEKGKKFWTILNSWGANWGEHGTIRLLRDNDDKYCGWDHDPLMGSACEATAPEKLRVCGTCGILVENIVPIFKAPAYSNMMAAAQECSAA